MNITVFSLKRGTAAPRHAILPAVQSVINLTRRAHISKRVGIRSRNHVFTIEKARQQKKVSLGILEL